MSEDNFIIIVPCRLGSKRLPEKPLKKIGKKTIIEHVALRLQAQFGDKLYIATDSDEIIALLTKSKINTLKTTEDCKTGTDRIYYAFQKVANRADIKYVINVQGDMPFIEPDLVESVLQRLQQEDCDIATPVAKIDADMAKSNSNVKVVINNNDLAMYFSRAVIPHGAQEFNYHIGIYGFTVGALEQFVQLEQGIYEQNERLEQLRALENGMRIGICWSNSVPISVDTPEDLEHAIKYYNDNPDKHEI